MTNQGYYAILGEGNLVVDIQDNSSKVTILEPAAKSNNGKPTVHQLVVIDNKISEEGLNKETFISNVNKILDKGQILELIVDILVNLKSLNVASQEDTNEKASGSFVESFIPKTIEKAKNPPKKTVAEVVNYKPSADDTLIQKPTEVDSKNHTV